MTAGVIANSVTGRHDAGGLDHQNDAFLRCACAMDHTIGHDKPFMRPESDRAILEVDQKLPIQAEEELIVLLVLMPVILSLHHTKPYHGAIHLAEGLVVPAVVDASAQRWH